MPLTNNKTIPGKSIGGWIIFILKKIMELLKILIFLDMALLIFWGLPFMLLKWSQHYHPAFHGTMIAICFIYFFASLWFFNRKNFYDDFDKKRILGVLFPLILLIAIVWVGATCFGALSAMLSDYGYISFDPVLKQQNFEPLVDFYFWHFCDLIPEIKVNETLQWDLLYKYKGNLMNLLLLLFKVIMVWIVIALFYKWNKWRNEDKKKYIFAGCNLEDRG